MRGGGPGTFGMATGLDHDHRLDAGGGTRRAHELPGRGHRLDIEEDRAGLGVGGEMIEKIAEVDVDHVAERDHGGEADRARLGPVENRGGDRAGLDDEGEVAHIGEAAGEAGVEMDAGHLHADAVGTNDPEEMRLGGIQRRLAERLAGDIPALAKAGSDDNRGPRAAPAELGDQSGHGRRRRRDHGEIGRRRQAGDVGIGPDALDRAPAGIDREHRAAEAGPEQVLGEDGADRARTFAGPDQRDRGGAEQSAEVALRHGDGA